MDGVVHVGFGEKTGNPTFRRLGSNLHPSKFAPKHSAIDVSRRVDAFYTQFFENGSVVAENELTKVGGISEKSMKSKFWLKPGQKMVMKSREKCSY